MRGKRIVIWYNENRKKYYYKIVNGFYTDYYVGYRNQYDHVVVLIIPLYDITNEVPRITRIMNWISDLLYKSRY